MQRDDGRFTVWQVADHPLDLVGIDVGRGRLDRGRQVENHRALRRGTPLFHDCDADIACEFELGAGEHLGAVFKAPVGARARVQQVLDHPGAADGQVDHFLLAQIEDDPSKDRCGGVVQVHRGVFGAFERLDRAGDQVFAGLGQHADHDIVGHQALFDDVAHEIEVGLRGGGKPDLDFLHADLQQGLEHAQLARGVHRFEQCLIAIAQVGRQPAGCCVDGPRRPGALGQVDDRERAVLTSVRLHHDLKAPWVAVGSATGTWSAEADA